MTVRDAQGLAPFQLREKGPEPTRSSSVLAEAILTID